MTEMAEWTPQGLVSQALDRPGFKSLLYSLLTKKLWENYLTSISSSAAEVTKRPSLMLLFISETWWEV